MKRNSESRTVDTRIAAEVDPVRKGGGDSHIPASQVFTPSAWRHDCQAAADTEKDPSIPANCEASCTLTRMCKWLKFCTQTRWLNCLLPFMRLHMYINRCLRLSTSRRRDAALIQGVGKEGKESFCGEVEARHPHCETDEITGQGTGRMGVSLCLSSPGVYNDSCPFLTFRKACLVQEKVGRLGFH